jgi:polyisoprenoid-binding protein YceI
MKNNQKSSLLKKGVFTLLFLASSVVAFAQTSLKVDPNHSRLGFVVTHLGIADVIGYFDKFDVNISSAKGDFSDAVVTLTADINSINTGIAQRDKHLKTADFFDAEKFGTMTFKSTSVKKVAENKYTLTGDLTFHGVTKAVTMDVLHRGTVKNPASGEDVTGIQLTGKIKRSDFNLGSKFPAPMISDEVIIKADGEFGPAK